MKRFSMTIYFTVLMCSFCVGILSPYLRLSKGETIFEDTEVSFLTTRNGETIGMAKGSFLVGLQLLYQDLELWE